MSVGGLIAEVAIIARGNRRIEARTIVHGRSTIHHGGCSCLCLCLGSNLKSSVGFVQQAFGLAQMYGSTKTISWFELLFDAVTMHPLIRVNVAAVFTMALCTGNQILDSIQVIMS